MSDEEEAASSLGANMTIFSPVMSARGNRWLNKPLKPVAKASADEASAGSDGLYAEVDELRRQVAELEFQRQMALKNTDFIVERIKRLEERQAKDDEAALQKKATEESNDDANAANDAKDDEAVSKKKATEESNDDANAAKDEAASNLEEGHGADGAE